MLKSYAFNCRIINISTNYPVKMNGLKLYLDFINGNLDINLTSNN